MSKQRGKLVLSSAEEEQLQQLIRAQSTPQGLAKRARVVQLAAQGMGVRAIGARVGMHFNQVAKWRRRYIRGGLGALQEERRSARKSRLSTEVLRQIVDQATRPPRGRARWTCRTMARELGVSKATVQRFWSENEIKPHLTRVFKLSTDPDFEAKFWVSPPICKPDKSNGLEFRFDLPFSCQASAKTLLHLVLFSSMCRLIPYLVPGGPSANTESASDFPTGGFIRFFRRCSQPPSRRIFKTTYSLLVKAL